MDWRWLLLWSNATCLAFAPTHHDVTISPQVCPFSPQCLMKFPFSFQRCCFSALTMSCSAHALSMHDTSHAMLFTSSVFALSQHAVSHPLRLGVPFWPITWNFSAHAVERSQQMSQNTVVQGHSADLIFMQGSHRASRISAWMHQ